MRTLVRVLLCGVRSYPKCGVPRLVHSVPLRSMSSQPPSDASSSAAVPLDKSPDNWFAKFSRATETPKGCFKGYSDRFNGITVDSTFEGSDDLEFSRKLAASLEFWTTTKRRGIWFKVNVKDSDWVPVLAKNGFTYHHAKDDFVMMVRWLPEDESAGIPPYAHTMIGVGAIVVNSKDQILAVSEQNALIPNSWKLPGGYAEPKENLSEAAIREVCEETNISCKFDSVVAIRHAHGAGFGCSDIYVVVALTPETEEIRKCDREIADCKWMNLDDFMTNENVHETNRNFLRTYVSLKKQGIKIGCHDEVHPLLKRKYQIYNVVASSGIPSSQL